MFLTRDGIKNEPSSFRKDKYPGMVEWAIKKSASAGAKPFG